jgi:stearoyl-CoA desaturase (delta-9 desaturase)
MRSRHFDWTNAVIIVAAHLMAVVGVVYLAAVNFSWPTVALAAVWYALCGLAITGGYHRLFAHPTYRAAWPLRALYLFFGAASAQNSALKWSADHRVHHALTDRDEDPYDISRGFWWAHIGWVFFRRPEEGDLSKVRDMSADPLMRLQHRFYVPLALFAGGILPAAIAGLWGDILGGLLVVGFLRLVVQWHATFSINSVAHTLGKRPYCARSSARDSWITALLTLGEGYHNFHHRFQTDYRNGVRWFQFDPTKWFVWCMSKLALARDLRRVPPRAIERAREAARAEGLARSGRAA